MGIIEAFLLAVIAGIIPGLHINTVSLLLKGSEYIPFMLGVYIPLTVIPLIFLSSSDSSNISNLFVIKKIKEGKLSPYLLFVSSISSIIGVGSALLLHLIFPDLIRDVGEILEEYIYYIVMAIALLMIYKSKNRKYFFIIFILSGILGFISFNSLRVEKFLPMFVGFFSLNALREVKKISIKQKSIEVRKIIFPSFLGALLGMLAVLFPGISSPSAMIGVISLSQNIGVLKYISMSYSFLSSQGFYSIINYELTGKARIGAISYSKGGDYLFLVLGVLVGSFVSYFLFKLLNTIAGRIKPLHIFIVLSFLVFYFEGVAGIGMMIIGYLLGRIREEKEVGGTSHLGSIIIPVLLNFIF